MIELQGIQEETVQLILEIEQSAISERDSTNDEHVSGQSCGR